MNNTLYEAAFERAGEMMDTSPDLEPKSALKQAGNDLGIPYGQEIQAFVDWALTKIDDDHDSNDDNRYPERI
jgi:hypothetical protein